MKLIWLLCLLAAPAFGKSLLEATQGAEHEAVAALLEGGANPSTPNAYGVTPLGIACMNGDARLVDLLLKHGAKIEPSGGEALMILAARSGSKPCLELLLERGCSPSDHGAGEQPPLMWAASRGHVDCVELLIKAGAAADEQLPSGFDALFFATRAGHKEVVAQLTQAGVDINDACKPSKKVRKGMRPGTSALMLAIENGHFELALEMVAAGADPNDQRTGFTPLHAMTWVRKTVRGDSAEGIPPPRGSGSVTSLEFVAKLIDAGADPNLRAKSGNGGGGRLNTKHATPFFLACWTGDLPLMKLLLEGGADPALNNVDDSTPLLAACGLGVPAPGEEPSLEKDAIAAAALLLEMGADINHVDKRGETTMHCAAYKSAPELIAFLDQRGARIETWNRKNKSGWTPLLIAQGFRPGNFRPIGYTVSAICSVMESHGVEPPASPPPPSESSDP